ncbi:Fe-S cluster protein [Methanocalculus chunghsingensis]|uniref:Fe-S cluster protein n=1 Tax=Methanocalculus chunghsingensis TaxID=156457 RepID=A0A8J7W5N8_9EURY|nr:(Fe-S)-binding protein [Methanocalculus chunghsingensis]MBR1368759.1 Fe-S cluster protein [Methanocalculus chunghsingensis]
MAWKPPGKDCGLCGAKTCMAFSALLAAGAKRQTDCPFYGEEKQQVSSGYSGVDLLGIEYDFVLHPFPGEPSTRKDVVPFRPDLVERWEIQRGDLVIGRPAGAGCPITHALRVTAADPVSGIISCHVTTPLEARSEDVKDIRAYHVHAFEGIAETVRREPAFGKRQRFLPGFCMMGLSHTGVVNMVIMEKDGLHVRVEGIGL